MDLRCFHNGLCFSLKSTSYRLSKISCSFFDLFLSRRKTWSIRGTLCSSWETNFANDFRTMAWKVNLPLINQSIDPLCFLNIFFWQFCAWDHCFLLLAVLTLYFLEVLLWSESETTLIYHLFSVLCYFTPVFGAMLADGFLGKFKCVCPWGFHRAPLINLIWFFYSTIFVLSIVYVGGLVLLTLSAIPPLQMNVMYVKKGHAQILVVKVTKFDKSETFYQSQGIFLSFQPNWIMK